MRRLLKMLLEIKSPEKIGWKDRQVYDSNDRQLSLEYFRVDRSLLYRYTVHFFIPSTLWYQDPSLGGPKFRLQRLKVDGHVSNRPFLFRLLLIILVWTLVELKVFFQHLWLVDLSSHSILRKCGKDSYSYVEIVVVIDISRDSKFFENHVTETFFDRHVTLFRLINLMNRAVFSCRLFILLFIQYLS